MECSGQVGANFFAENSKPSVTLLPDLLQQVPILFFAGDQDLICVRFYFLSIGAFHGYQLADQVFRG